MRPSWIAEEFVEAGPRCGLSAASTHVVASATVLQLADIGITRGVCVVHAERSLNKAYRSLFKDFSKEKLDTMRKDIEMLKVCANHPAALAAPPPSPKQPMPPPHLPPRLPPPPSPTSPPPPSPPARSLTRLFCSTQAFLFPLLETCMIKLMLRKWCKTNGLNEEEVAKAWAAGWAHDNWTLLRTGLN